MEDDSAAVKFKKRNRNIRKRDVQSDEESQPTEIPFLEENYHTEILKNAKEKNEKRKKKKDKLKDADTKSAGGVGLGIGLSFGDEEDESGAEVFKVKKSSHSKKMAKKAKDRQKELKELDKKQPKNDPSNTQLASTGQYTKEKLASLKKENIILSGKVAEAMAEEEDDKNEIAGKFRNLTTGSIPDANLIHMARKKRQMAREMGQQDYIAIDDTQTYATNDSRLIRDDDNDNSDDDDDDKRMGFSVRHKTNRERIIESIDINQFASDNHDKREMDLFEEEQIRKGINTNAPQGQVEQSTSQAAYYYPSDAPYLAPVTYSEDYGVLEYSDEAPPPPMALLPMHIPVVSLDTLKKTIADRYESVDEVYRSHEREDDKLNDQLESSRHNSEKLKESTKVASEQYSFFQEMRGYVSDLIECLNEKVPIITGLDLTMNVLLKQRAQLLVTRRQTDIKDQASEFISSKAASAPNLGIKGKKKNKDEETMQRRIAEREARRARRRRARESKTEGIMHYEGMSSDDEIMETNKSKFIADKNRLIEEANALFSDVTEDFKSVVSIEERFQSWKFDQSESYHDAYISLCLPKLFSPFVKLQLISWNPLEPNNKDLEEYRWHDDLLFFGCQNVDVCDRDDPDLELIPNIVDKFVIPKLCGLVENVWDPMSTSQTHRLVTMVHKLSEDYPTVSTENKNTQTLLTAVVARMRKTLDDDVYMPLFPKSVLENRSSGAFNFLQRQFWSCVKLLGNMLNWQGIIVQDTLLDIAVDGLLNRYLLLSLQNSDVNEDSINKCQQIVSTFPKDWFKNLEGDSTIRQLEPFCRYLSHAADTCYKGSFASSDLDKRKSKGYIKTITKLLVNIHAMKHALDITSELSLKDMQEIVNDS
ncbi:PAX3- and PAX7-binding protein 1-like [Antedon mediterranea]|uniref:PAX3- and PAX7-binding protein 1-like n=1 Tax=Antedon mediterranea TaxID=105859 RepID=UPI003AF5CA2C